MRVFFYATLSAGKTEFEIIAKSNAERRVHSRITMHEFRLQKWVEGGIFGEDIDADYLDVAGLVNTGDGRL